MKSAGTPSADEPTAMPVRVTGAGDVTVSTALVAGSLPQGKTRAVVIAEHGRDLIAGDG